MNHLKASLIRKKHIIIAEEEKYKHKSKKRPTSSIKTINEMPNAHDIVYENPPL